MNRDGLVPPLDLSPQATALAPATHGPLCDPLLRAVLAGLVQPVSYADPSLKEEIAHRITRHRLNPQQSDTHFVWCPLALYLGEN